MSEGQAGDGLGPEPPAEEPSSSPLPPLSDEEGGATTAAPPMVRTVGPRAPVDPAAVLLAVERVGADVTALGRALAAQPEEVAARLDVDAATASIGVRIGTLGSAVDQLRLSLLAGLDRAAEHADAPPWLPDLQARLDTPRWLRDLNTAMAALAPRLDAPPWLGDLQTSLRELAAHVDAPPWLAELHATLVDLKPLVAEQQRALRDAVTQLAVLELSLATAPGNEPVLNAIARLPGDDRLRELSTTVERVADESHNLSERLGKIEQSIAELTDGVRAGAAIADVLDQLGQRLHSIEDAAARVATDAQTLVEQVVPIPDRLTAIAVQVDRITPLARAGDQAGTLFDQLARVTTGLDQVTALLQPALPDEGRGDEDSREDDDGDLDERLEAVVDVLAGVTRRQDHVTEAADAVLERLAQQERSMASQLGWVGERLAEVAAYLVPDASAGRIDEPLAELSEGLAGLAHRQEALAVALSTLLERDRGNEMLAEQLATVAQRQDELAATLSTLLERDEGLGPLAAQIALLSRRQEELTAALASSFDEGRGPMAAAAVFDRMEQRERSLAARLDRIDAQLRRAGPGAPEGEPGDAAVSADRTAAMSLAASVEAIATVTENLATLVESSSERIDRRLSKVELALAEVQRTGPPPSPRPAAASGDTAAASRLAELRAQRAEVQARLQEERQLAAQGGQIWDDDR